MLNYGINQDKRNKMAGPFRAQGTKLAIIDVSENQKGAWMPQDELYAQWVNKHPEAMIEKILDCNGCLKIFYREPDTSEPPYRG